LGKIIISLKKYLPLGAEELAIDYPFSEFSDSPERIFYSVKELLIHLQDDPIYEYTIYYQNNDKYQRSSKLPCSIQMMEK